MSAHTITDGKNTEREMTYEEKITDSFFNGNYVLCVNADDRIYI